MYKITDPYVGLSVCASAAGLIFVIFVVFFVRVRPSFVIFAVFSVHARPISVTLVRKTADFCPDACVENVFSSVI